MPRDKGYITAEEVYPNLGKVQYDEDNLAFETAQMFPRDRIQLISPQPRRIEDLAVWENASPEEIQRALDRIK